MPELLRLASRRSVLAGSEPSLSGIPRDAAVIAQLAPRARFILRLDPALLSTITQPAGFTLDMSINRRSVAAQRMATRLGPDEWLLCAPEAEAGAIVADIQRALAECHFSLVDVGHRQVAFGVSGARAIAVLNSGCPLDLSPAAFPTAHATRTLLGKCEVIVARTDDAPTFEIECARSFAAYVYDFLLEAAREFRA